MDKEFGSFRKAAFGGFNRRDVINYIEKMRNESFEYRKQVDETVKNLNEKILELENAARLIESSCVSEDKAYVEEASTEYLSDIGPATKHLKNVADELCRSLGDFMEKLSEKGFFDRAEEEAFEIDEPELICEENEKSIVDGILSSLSYLDDSACKSEALTVKSKKEETNISELLTGSFFVK